MTGVLMSERDKDRLRSAFPEYVARVEAAEKNILRSMWRKIVALNEKDATND